MGFAVLAVLIIGQIRAGPLAVMVLGVLENEGVACHPKVSADTMLLLHSLAPKTIATED